VCGGPSIHRAWTRESSRGVAAQVATWVNREPTKKLHIHSACFVASHMGCIHVAPQPVCRNPCKRVRALRR
jgi:hypothetical protein